jgi:hypothetical protein
MEDIKLIPDKINVIVRLCCYDYASKVETPDIVHFELHTMCDVPILTFKFRKPGEVVVVPVNFRTVATWPKAKKLTIRLQQFDLRKDLLMYEKTFILNEEDTTTIQQARWEQQKMKKRQIDAIADFIYSDYIGFAGLSEVF